MVYTHYWAYQPDSTEFTAAFPQLLADAHLILASLSERGVALAGPTGIGQPLLNESIIAFNGVRPNTGENFVLAPAAGSGLTEHTEAGEPFKLDYVQTRALPYDLAVTAILLRAHQLAPWSLTLASDGSWEQDWRAARDLLDDLFGTSPQLDALASLEVVRRGPYLLQLGALSA
ncbi:MAG TPA: hypothetical protein VL551_11725 [Actinospica sp.]|jgi:hypothetical protein|nr:hypothetical protein [Actinospica sp.]